MCLAQRNNPRPEGLEHQPLALKSIATTTRPMYSLIKLSLGGKDSRSLSRHFPVTTNFFLIPSNS